MEKPCGGRLLFTMTQHFALPEGLGSKSALSRRGKEVWEAVVLLWEKAGGEGEEQEATCESSPFPVAHGSWTETKEVLITQPGLDDIFFCQKCLSVSCRDFSADSGTLFLLVIAPLQLQLLRVPPPKKP